MQNDWKSWKELSHLGISANKKRKGCHSAPFGGSLFRDIAFSVKKLCDQNCAACGTAQSIVRETDELIVVHGVLAQTTDRHAHTAVKIAVELCLGAVVFLKVGDELFGSGGEA